MTVPAAVLSPEERALVAAFEQFGERLAEPRWRLTSGALYNIMTKSDGVVPFVPNALQLDFLDNMHHREVILKSRQIGFTTLISLYFLDHALFNADQRCAQIAQDLDKVAEIFRDKVRFAFDRLPPFLLPAFPLKKATETLLHFAHNNSIIFVDTSTRGGTVHRLHVSEFGKISVQAPLRAREIVTGAFPSVPETGVAIAESTAEGQEGEFYNLSAAAEARAKNPAPLLSLEWNFHFYAWWQHEDYQTDPAGVAISAEDHAYFDKVEAKVVLAGKRPAGWKLSLPQRAWYVLYRKTQFSGDSSKMWPEMPSLPEEAWLRSPEGVFYAEQLTQAVAERRMRPLPFHSYTPVDTFWDIGSKDGTAIWLIQKAHPSYHVLRYVEGWFKPYVYFTHWLDKIAEEAGVGWTWGTHFLPHDAQHKRQLQHKVAAPVDLLQEIKPTWRFEIVPPVDELQHGISATRRIFNLLYFNVDDALPDNPDAEQAPDCRRGVTHLWNYRKRRNERTGGWMDEPVKNEATEAADALRQFAQAFDNLNPTVRAGQRPNRRGAAMRIS